VFGSSDRILWPLPLLRLARTIVATSDRHAHHLANSPTARGFFALPLFDHQERFASGLAQLLAELDVSPLLERQTLPFFLPDTPHPLPAGTREERTRTISWLHVSAVVMTTPLCGQSTVLLAVVVC
jgi:hypothetical protein